MFIRPYSRTINGTRRAYWALVESYRTERGPRQRVVAWLGQLDEAGRLGIRQAAEGKADSSQKKLFPEPQPEWVEVNVQAVRVENCRQFGGPWLVLELIKRLGLDDFLQETMPPGREEVPWSVMALVLVIARLCEPSSELSIAENFSRKTALCDLVGVPSNQFYGKSNRIWVMDRGMVSEQNLEFLRQAGRRYIVGTPKSLLKKFEQELLQEDWHTIRDGLEVKLCSVPRDDDHDDDSSAPSAGQSQQSETFILCRSRDRFQKDEAILRRVEQHIEERLTKMAARCEKQKRDPMKVEREVGRLLGQNTRAAKLFEVNVETTDEGHARIKWRKVEIARDWATLSGGCYLLRSNVTDWTDEELWKAYIQLTEAEAAFRIHKSDLSIRPIWHQKEERVLAHILVCFLAYVLWKTLTGLCQRAGLGDEPRRVLEELQEIRVVDVVLPTRQGVEIRRRCVTRPSDHQAILLHKLGLDLPRRLKTIEM